MTFDDAPVEGAPQLCRTASAGTMSMSAGGRSRRPVGRVLYRPFPGGDDHSSGTSVAGRLVRPTRAATRRTPAGTVRPGLPLLFGLAPGGVYPAGSVAEAAGRSYRPVSPLPAGGRTRRAGGLFSVALSLGSPPPGVTRHRSSVEPGPSSPGRAPGAAVRPSGPNLHSDLFELFAQEGEFEPLLLEGCNFGPRTAQQLRHMREPSGVALVEAGVGKHAL